MAELDAYVANVSSPAQLIPLTCKHYEKIGELSGASMLYTCFISGGHFCQNITRQLWDYRMPGSRKKRWANFEINVKLSFDFVDSTSVIVK